MSLDDTKSIDSLDYDSVSVTESVDNSPLKVKKKKKLGFFRSKKSKEEKFISNDSLEKENDHLSLSINDVTSIKAEKKFAAEVNGFESNLLNTGSLNSSMTDVSLINASVHKKKQLVEMVTHKLYVRLRSGENLAARDANGSSDPYVKFKVDGQTVHKSKVCKENLNPHWDEEFDISLNLHCDVSIWVYDKDFASKDDFMGSGKLDLTSLKNEFDDITIDLGGSSNPGEELGCVHLEVRLAVVNEEAKKSKLLVDDSPQEGISPVASFDQRSAKSFRNSFVKQHNASILNRNRTMATIQLISGLDIPARDSNGLSDPYVKLILGKVKKKSKVCYKTLNPVWKEEFVFNLNPENPTLEIGVYDKDTYRKDDFIGKCFVDLASLSCGTTHSLFLNLIDTQGKVHILITIHSPKSHDLQVTRYDLSEIRLRYGISSTFNNLPDVGFAELRVISASGLRSADINGKSDPYCVVHLCNALAQTPTCFRTLDPTWDCVYTFPVHDIHDVFDFWIFDQDANGEKEFLGRVCVPILRCKNGEEHTYCLKDKKLKNKVKGTITIQINYILNPVRAAVRTFSPREDVFMEEAVKFKVAMLSQNFSRVWAILQQFFLAADFINSCFTWKNKTRSFTAFIMFLLIVWNFELYMLPIVLLMLLIKNYVDIFVKKTRPPRHLMSADEAQREGDDDDDEEDEGNKLNFFQRLRAIEGILVKVQLVLDAIASLGERVYNTFSWSVPFLGWLLVIVLCIVTLVLYLIPLRVIILLWGINKFTKRLRKPNFVPNNEILDYLSRIPSNIELDKYREYQQEPSPSHSKKKR